MTPVVLVVGHAAAGKSTVARAIAATFGLPLLSKDGIKERLFDLLGTGDRAWSRRLGVASFGLLEDVIELQLAAGAPFVVDANFDSGIAAPRFATWAARYERHWIQVHCVAPDEVLIERYATRAVSGERHPGHGDEAMATEFAAGLHDRHPETFDLPGALIRVDTAVEPTARTIDRLRPSF